MPLKYYSITSLRVFTIREGRKVCARVSVCAYVCLVAGTEDIEKSTKVTSRILVFLFLWWREDDDDSYSLKRRDPSPSRNRMILLPPSS